MKLWQFVASNLPSPLKTMPRQLNLLRRLHLVVDQVLDSNLLPKRLVEIVDGDALETTMFQTRRPLSLLRSNIPSLKKMLRRQSGAAAPVDLKG